MKNYAIEASKMFDRINMCGMYHYPGTNLDDSTFYNHFTVIGYKTFDDSMKRINAKVLGYMTVNFNKLGNIDDISDYNNDEMISNRDIYALCQLYAKYPQHPAFVGVIENITLI